MLYSLYELALDMCKTLPLDDADAMNKRLHERQRLLRKTEAIAEEAQKSLADYEALRSLPANEKALISEKRQMILDLLGRMCDVENTMLKAMHTRMVGLRRELMGVNGRQKAIHAYRAAPALA